MRKIIHDCDCTFGINGCDVDDGLALLYLLGDPEDDGHPGERGRGAARPRPRRTRHGGLSGIPVLPQSVV